MSRVEVSHAIQIHKTYQNRTEQIVYNHKWTNIVWIICGYCSLSYPHIITISTYYRLWRNFKFNFDIIHIKLAKVVEMDNTNDTKNALRDIGISQTKLAKILDTNLTTVNNWFSRGSIPNKHKDKITQLLSSDGIRTNSSSNTAQIGTQKTQHDQYKPIYENRVAQNTNKTYISLQNINTNITDSFVFDISLVSDNSVNSLRWDKIRQHIHIIDIYVDKYEGNGSYYLQYPHNIEYVDIEYLPFEKCYSIKGLKEFYKISNLSDFTNIIKGKVIYKITAV